MADNLFVMLIPISLMRLVLQSLKRRNWPLKLTMQQLKTLAHYQPFSVLVFRSL